MRSTTTPSTRSRRMKWGVPAALIILSLIPVIAGAARLTQLTGGATVTPENARFFASPIPVVTHIVTVTVYSLLGAFQFVPALRRVTPHQRGSQPQRRRLSWHQVAGRILVPAGLLAAVSGLWMSMFYTLPVTDGQALMVLRLIFGFGMLGSIVLGLLAIRRRDFAVHGAWMTRAYAIAVGAGTQALVLLPWTLIVGPTDQTMRAVLMGASWAINLVVAEYFIQRRRATVGSARNQGDPPSSVKLGSVSR
ncbi:DUF2306 domain-containing protein [Paenarthrobacter aurescens]|nr:DUF2306 domain-containing protein [Paenarthrobacter aurescens]MDO6142200.1 DUF2306 domain-containing protein [Paenarthrobacter aurescens]MDO6146048.1 DUF2306 domain-containing protein [Paenarthrobacter aurescens]MDO6157292.1 DUF2306 domain-containing protein [Paenarthrobacter aurescens]MDO6161277.1 DUF2306 domain-containing protein [Paenarthrobacter aurescens]